MIRVGFSVNSQQARQLAGRLSLGRREEAVVAAARFALLPVVPMIAAAAPVGHSMASRGHLKGLLKRSIGLQVDRGAGGVRVRITSAPHGHLVEGGHRMVIGGRVPRLTVKTRSVKIRPTRSYPGQVVGMVPPHPFAGPVLHREQDAIENRLSVAMVAELLKQMRIEAVVTA